MHAILFFVVMEITSWWNFWLPLAKNSQLYIFDDVVLYMLFTWFFYVAFCFAWFSFQPDEIWPWCIFGIPWCVLRVESVLNTIVRNRRMVISNEQLSLLNWWILEHSTLEYSIKNRISRIRRWVLSYSLLQKWQTCELVCFTWPYFWNCRCWFSKFHIWAEIWGEESRRDEMDLPPYLSSWLEFQKLPR